MAAFERFADLMLSHLLWTSLQAAVLVATIALALRLLPRLPPIRGFQVTAFTGGPGELQTLGLHLLQGRDFLPSEYVPLNDYKGMNHFSVAIISRSLAERLFHSDDAVGRLFYTSDRPIRVVGVVAHLMGMSPQLGASDNEYAMLLPVQPDGDYVTFVLRTSRADRGRVLSRPWRCWVTAIRCGSSTTPRPSHKRAHNISVATAP
ncbi:MAG TPA: ABC transporter permease [Rhodanobacteraceae bacterium]|nr:ABC transporter permease [Rhodanobacteraceae bacterium]